METNDWTGAYPSKWAGIILPEAMTHPAKFSSRLIARIYDHILQENWVARGSTILDPFGGMALGSFFAQKHGLVWRGVEIEENFFRFGNQNIESWNARFSRMPGWSTDARLLHGDSRKLLEVIGGAQAAVSSPPYAESMGNSDKSGIDWSKQQDRSTDHPHGWNGAGYSQQAAIVSSPPYADANGHPSIGSVNKDDWGHQGSDIVARRGLAAKYGATPGQLGSMRANGFSAAVSSFDGKSKINYEEGQWPDRLAQGIISSPPYNKPMSQEHPGTRGGKRGTTPSEAGAFVRYGNTEGQIEGLADDDFWTAARTIVEQTYAALAMGGVAVWVTKAYVKAGKLVDFPGQWRQLCEAVGFETLHEHHAMLVKHNGTSYTLDGGTVEHKIEYVSFFRRLAQSKGSPRIDFEVVYCMMKPGK